MYYKYFSVLRVRSILIFTQPKNEHTIANLLNRLTTELSSSLQFILMQVTWMKSGMETKWHKDSILTFCTRTIFLGDVYR
jgi:uncharacterized membrane protein YozB (DUF420 family)